MGKAELVATEVQETEPGAMHTRVIILWIQASANSVVPLEQIIILKMRASCSCLPYNALHVTSMEIMIRVAHIITGQCNSYQPTHC